MGGAGIEAVGGIDVTGETGETDGTDVVAAGTGLEGHVFVG